MKDLIQEGRKIQETFKKNVINEEGFFAKIANKLRGMGKTVEKPEPLESQPAKKSKYGNWGVVDYDEADYSIIVNYRVGKSYLSKINSMPFAKKFKKINGTWSMVDISGKVESIIVRLWFEGSPDTDYVEFWSIPPFAKYSMSIINKDRYVDEVDNEYKKLLQDLGNVICSDLKKEAESFDLRNIQETFKKNVITEGKWKFVETDDNPFGMGEIHTFKYDRSLFDFVGNFFKKVTGKLPKIEDIVARLNILDGEYKEGNLEIKIVLGNPIRTPNDDYEVGYQEEFDSIVINSKKPFSSFQVSSYIENKKNSTKMDDAEMKKLITQLLGELKPELQEYM